MGFVQKWNQDFGKAANNNAALRWLMPVESAIARKGYKTQKNANAASDQKALATQTATQNSSLLSSPITETVDNTSQDLLDIKRKQRKSNSTVLSNLESYQNILQ